MDTAERQLFWEKLNDRCRQNPQLSVTWRPDGGKKRACYARTTIRAARFRFLIREGNTVAVELLLDDEQPDTNEKCLDWLHSKRESIEAEFGGPLVWDEADDSLPRRDSRRERVRYYLPEGPLPEQSSDWDRILDSMTAAMSRLVSALAPFVQLRMRDQ